MEPMSQEYVTEVDAEEVKLNAEINSLLDGIDFQQSLSQETSPTCIPSSFPEENGFTCEQQENNRDEDISSPALFSQEKEEKSPVIVPVLQPFSCSQEKKSPIFYEDPMDTLEELPVADVEDTYLTDEQFNQKYPQHATHVSTQSITPVTLVTLSNSCNSCNTCTHQKVTPSSE